MDSAAPEPELQGVSIVALGGFNPAIFQPAWFAGNNLIRPEESHDANIQIIQAGVAIFSTEWFSIQVTRDRFMIETRDPSKWLPLRDLLIGTFTLLSHTPVTAVGYNSNQHYRMSTEAEWHAFGHHFAPKSSWHPILINPGMRTLTMEGKRESCDADLIQIRLEPSEKIKPGVFIAVNEHYDLVDPASTPVESMRVMMLRLQRTWDGFLAYRTAVARQMFLAVHPSRE